MTTDEALRAAIETSKPIRFTYDKPGKVQGERVGNPHALYLHPTTGNPNCDIYQTDGVSDSGQLPDWRPFTIPFLTVIEVLTDEPSFDPAEGYEPNSPLYAKVIVKV